MSTSAQNQSIENVSIPDVLNAGIPAIIQNIRAAQRRVREGANKQVISSQVDSLIKISRIWANFFPANTSNQPI